MQKSKHTMINCHLYLKQMVEKDQKRKNSLKKQKMIRLHIKHIFAETD